MNWESHLSAVLIIGLGLLLAVSSTDVNQYIVRQEYDICTPNTEVTYPNTIYLPAPESTTEVYAHWSPLPNQPTDINCLLYVRTCDNCRIQVTSTGASFNYPPCLVTVTPGDDVPDDVCVPNCAYFYLFDADYKSQTSQVLTKSPVSYKTESKQLHVTACALNYNETVNMRLRLTVTEKVKEINDMTLQTHSFRSPYFPSPYAKNGELYTFKLIAQEMNKIVILSFDDWLITPSSYFEFSGSKDIVSVSGTSNRPTIQSMGPNLNVTFYTGDPTISQSSFLGFKATVQFISKYVTVVKSSTACDQEITTEGGIIRLAIADGQTRDCIFLIRKMPKFDGVYLRVLKTSIDDQSDYYDYSFDIHGGITSVGELKAQVNRNDPVPNNTILLSSDGFYIRYKGRYYAGPSHVLAYSMYIFDCDDYSGYFRCKNDLCIAMFLKCDGYDHCGDGSDEYASLCTYETTHSSSSYPIGIGVIIPLVVSIFLIIVMCVLIILIRRCRRLNNAARSQRPPGARSNRHRSRHNRDVQMSVTVRSGEHPPSYDEVLQNTPIGYLNMAFTWSQGNNLAQPPSYDEAVSPSSQQNGSIIITATANNGISREETIRNSHPTSATLLTTTISASLDPRVEVSSSSSSEDAPDRFRQSDFSSSSDSSIENEHYLAPHGHIDNSRSSTNLNKAGKDLNNEMSSLSSFPKYVNNEVAHVVLGSPGSGKVNSEGHERVKPVINQLMDESDGNRNLNNAGENQLVKEARDQYQSFSDLRNASNSSEVQGLPSSERFDGRSRGVQNHTVIGGEDFKNAERESKQGRARVDMYHKNKGKHSHQNVRESEGTYANGVNVHPPKVTDSSRSQSCFDLSLGAGAVKLLEGGSAVMRNEDKRFSYAGAGDTSLVREGLGPFYNGRGLIREKPLEHLDRYASQSYDNVRDGNTLRKHNQIDYKAGNEQDEDQQHRPRQSSNPSGRFPKGTRDKTDSLRAKGQYSNLASVTENLYDEAYVPDSIPEATDRHMYNEHTDKLKKPSTNNNWPQHRRNPLESGRGSSQAHEVHSSQKTNPESRGPSREHLLPGSTRSWPAKTTAMTPGHNYVHSYDHRKPTSDERSREQAENRSSRNNSDIQNINANSSKSIAHSALQNAASNSRGNGSTEYNKVPQSDQDTAASMFRPKPSLRKSRMKNAQRPDGHVAESLPNRSSQGHTQTSQKPVPAPRHGIQKPEPVDGRRPQADAQHEWGMQGTNKAQIGQHERRDKSSLQTTGQVNSRGHINVEATNDDVFV